MSAPVVAAVAPHDFSRVVGDARAIDDAVLATDGHAALGDGVWRDLAQPQSDSLALVIEGRGFAHVARSDNFAPPHWAVGLAVTRAGRDATVVSALIESAAEHVARHGGGPMVVWVFAVTPSDDEVMLRCGLVQARDLYQMRVPLPLPEPPIWPAGIVVRDFVPGRDEAAWLHVNNRAFANHPEQGAWIESTLVRREQEPWFDPTLFVLAFDAEGLAGFNWCKIHPAEGDDPPLGEIFVIGVDPRLAGHGLGRPLAIEGLARMSARGLTTGSLFTDAENAPALKLYRGLGFEVYRIDRSYVREVAAA
jgi:mycothiol synthase